MGLLEVGVVASSAATGTEGFGSGPLSVVAGRQPGRSSPSSCIIWFIWVWKACACAACVAACSASCSWSCEMEEYSISIPVSSPVEEGPAFDFVERVSIVGRLGDCRTLEGECQLRHV